MKAFVTGSTGLLGSNLVRLLAQQGHEVKAMARSTEKAQRLLGNLDRVTIVNGDMENIDGFAHELDGCDALFHTAAYFREYYNVGDHWQKLEQINVIGTIDLLTAAEKYGVKKAIHTSSSGVLGKTADGSNPDESTPPDQNVMDNLYFKSKVLAEEKIHVWQRDHSMPVVIINPTAIYGPGDAAPTTSGQVMINFIHGEFPAIPPGGFNVVDARDVAQGMIAAFDKGVSGERYILNNTYYSLKEMITIVGQVAGVDIPRIVLPYPVALTFANLSEFVARVTGGDAAMPVSGIKAMQRHWVTRNDKAKRVLGFTPRPFEETIRDEVQWFVDNGYIQREVTLKPLMQAQ